MPTYRNDTDRRITYCDMGYMEWQPGEEKRLGWFVPHAELGLTLVSGEPAGDSMIHTWAAELSPGEPVTLNLAYHEAFDLSITAVCGCATIRAAGTEEPFSVSPGENHVSSYSYARCPALELVSEEGATLAVKQEERNFKNTLRRGISGGGGGGSGGGGSEGGGGGAAAG